MINILQLTKNEDGTWDYQTTQITGGYGNKVLVSWSKGSIQEKESIINPTLKEIRESKMIDYLNSEEQSKTHNDNTIHMYKTKLKHLLILFIMKYINNDRLTDKLIDAIYNDRKFELIND